ncbi:MAG: S41 family peptidase [Woeseiaceae bacterium]
MARKRLSVWMVLLAFVGGHAAAEDAATNYSDAAEELADLLQTYYLFPEVGEQYAAYLESHAAKGDYDVPASDFEFADSVTNGLQGISEDAHLRVSATGAAAAPDGRRRRVPGSAPREVIQNASWLADGVAYVALAGLPESEKAQNDMARFLEEYAGAHSLVLDLRFCPGGSLSVMDVLFSRLYAEPTHLVTMDMRRGAGGMLESAFMDLPSLEQQDAPEGIVRWHHMAQPINDDDPWADTRVYVLTDMTASACEHLTLALKGTDRATIVGGRTRGAGHFGNIQSFGNEQFEVFVPVGRTYDPETNRGWEGGGILPHVEVLPERALERVIAELDLAAEEVTLPPAMAMPQMQRSVSASGGPGYGIGMMPPRGGETYLSIAQVIDDGVAQRAGLQAGDRIVNINGKAVAELEKDELRGLMRQSPLALQVERGDTSLAFELSLD